MLPSKKRVEDLRELQHLMMENLAEGILLTSVADNTIIYANVRFEKMFGYAKGELIGKHVSVLNDGTDNSPEVVANNIVKRSEEHGFWEGEIRNIKKDGSFFWTRVKIVRVQNNQYGDVWLSIQDDITSQKEEHHLLAESEKKFRLLFEKSIDAILLVTADGGVLDANPEACHLLGRTVGELKKIGRAGVVDQSDKRSPRLFREREERRKYRGKFAVVNKTGERIECLASSVKYLDVDGKEYSHVVLRNVSDIRKKELELAEQLVLYETLFESTTEPVVIWDPLKWRVIKANKVALTRLGLKSLKEMQKRGGPEKFSLGIQPDGRDSRELVVQMGKQAMVDGRAEFEWWHEGEDGNQYPVRVVLQRIDVGSKVYLQANISRTKNS